MGFSRTLFIFSLSFSCLFGLSANAATDAELLRQSLKDLDLNSSQNRPKLQAVYQKVRAELPSLAQKWMDRAVESVKDETVPTLEFKSKKGTDGQDIVAINFRLSGEEILMEIDLDSLNEPLKLNGETLPALAWWSEKELNVFLISLPKKTAALSKSEIFAFMFLPQAFAESINERAKELACKNLPAPKVCSEANPQFLKRYQAARKMLELEMKQNPTLKNKPAPEPERQVASAPSAEVRPATAPPRRMVAAIVGMSLVWKSFYKNKNSSSEAPVPMKVSRQGL